jgi:hypothetical protein
MEIDAVSIENAFARLLGNEIGVRGTCHDADIFRGGNLEQIAKSLEKAADAIESKVNSFTFEPTETEAGGAKACLGVAIDRIRNIASKMSSLKESEPNDYHWEIIGCLISTVSALLETLSRRNV